MAPRELVPVVRVRDWDGSERSEVRVSIKGESRLSGLHEADAVELIPTRTGIVAGPCEASTYRDGLPSLQIPWERAHTLPAQIVEALPATWRSITAAAVLAAARRRLGSCSSHNVTMRRGP